MNRDDALLEREVFLGATRFLREQAQELRRSSCLKRWVSSQERAYGRYLAGELLARKSEALRTQARILAMRARQLRAISQATRAARPQPGPLAK